MSQKKNGKQKQGKDKIKIGKVVLSMIMLLALIVQAAVFPGHHITAQQVNAGSESEVKERDEPDMTKKSEQQTPVQTESDTENTTEKINAPETQVKAESEPETESAAGDRSIDIDKPSNRAEVQPMASNTFSYEGIQYSYDPVTKEAAVDLQPDTLDLEKKDYIKIYAGFTYQDVYYAVTEIKKNAFDMNRPINNEGSTVSRDKKARLSGKTLEIPETVVKIGSNAFMQRKHPPLAKIIYKKVAYIDGELPDLQGQAPTFGIPEEVKQYDDWVNNSEGVQTFSKAAKWTNDNLTEAEIRLDYARHPNYKSRLDIVFVMDQSSSMQASVPFVGRDGMTYNYQRFMYQDDIVQGMSELLLENPPAGYDNRVALVGFGGSVEDNSYYPLLWSSNDFHKNLSDLEMQIYSHPTTNSQNTHYGQALDEARRIINERPDKTRTPVVIFLSDGEPNDFREDENGTIVYDIEDIDGKETAQLLRDDHIRVYPVGVLINQDDEAPKDAMKAISYNENTYYDAKNVASLIEIMQDVVDEIITRSPLDLTITDVIADPFELADGEVGDIVTISEDGGSARISGDQLIWDLNGCSPEQMHNIRIKVKLKQSDHLSATGPHPTNTSLVTSEGIIAENQPVLKRFLVRHVFRNGTVPGQLPPQEVLDILETLPSIKGGYKDETVVTPTEPVPDKVTTASGEIWEFASWDKSSDTINDSDVVFTGTWVRTGIDFRFIKTNTDGEKLNGAAFDIYLWKGSSAPGETDRYISAANISSTQWVKAGSMQEPSGGVFAYEFTAPGLYQLVETAAPPGYQIPEAQWRLNIDDTFVLTNITTIPENEDAALVTDFVNTGSGENNKWSLVNLRRTTLEVKKTISNFDQQTESARSELSSRSFFIKVAGGAQGGVTLRHGETSGKMNLKIAFTPVEVEIIETVPMDFDQQYEIVTEITHADQQTDTINGNKFTVQEGDSISVHVKNTFKPASFFKGRDSIHNTFGD